MTNATDLRTFDQRAQAEPLVQVARQQQPGSEVTVALGTRCGSKMRVKIEFPKTALTAAVWCVPFDMGNSDD